MTDYGYKATDSGAKGKTFERDLKARLGLLNKVSSAGNTDIRKGGVCYEAKTHGGQISTNLNSKLVKGSSRVIFAPVIDMSLPVEEQEGFVLSREKFLEILFACNLVREKTSTAGVRLYAMQTYWNNSKNAPHGKGYDRLLAALYDAVDNGEAETLADWLERW